MSGWIHRETGLVFHRSANCRPVYVTGNTYEHRQALARAGFRWDAARKRYSGTIEDAVALDVPRANEISSALGNRTKTKIGTGRRVIR